MIGIGERSWFTILLAMLAGLLLYLSLGLSPVARFVPLTVLLPTLILMLGQLVLDMVLRPDGTRKRERRVDLFQSEMYRGKTRFPSGKAECTRDAGASLPGRERIFIIWLLMFLLCIYLFGFAIAMPLFILLYLKKRSGEGWLFSISTALLAAGLLYVLFYLVLQDGLYEGILRTWLV